MAKRKQVGIRLDDRVVAKVLEYAKEHNSNTSCVIEFILCRFFDIKLQTPEELLAEKEAEIDRLKKELEVAKRHQRLATNPALEEDRFTMEKG